MDRRAMLLGAGGLMGLGAAVATPAGARAADDPDAALGIVSVADFGAKGDGRSDSTAAVVAAMAAVTARAVVGGDRTGIVWFPAGVHRVSMPIAVPRNVTLVGESMLASKLVYSGPRAERPFVTFGSPGRIDVNTGVVGMQVDAAGRLPWAMLMYGPQEGSTISRAHICGGTVGGVDVRSGGIEGGCNKFTVDHGTWIWTEGDGGMYGMRFDDANGPLSIRDVTLVGVNRTKAPPSGSAGLWFDGGIQHVSGVNVERFESHTSIDGWSSFRGDTLSTYGDVTNCIRRRRYDGADPSVRYSVENVSADGVELCIRDEHAGVTIARTRSYSNRTVDSSAWDGSHLTMGAHHLWVDARGRLRIKSGRPGSDADGAVVASQA